MFPSNIVSGMISLTMMNVLVAAQASERAGGRSFMFPSGVKSALSYSGNLTATYIDPGINADGIHVYQFAVLDRTGRHLADFEFLRSVAGAWESSTDKLFVNNFIGSNATDCVVLQRKAGRLAFQSLTDALETQPGSGPVDVRGIKPPETPNNSHFYLTCDKWGALGDLDVNLKGVTDAGGTFVYNFVYDTNTGRFSVK